jgi:hypothetical protein
VHYATEGVPSAEHLLVLRANDSETLNHWLAGRIYKPLFLYESQGLEVYIVYAASPTAVARTLPAALPTESDADSSADR